MSISNRVLCMGFTQEYSVINKKTNLEFVISGDLVQRRHQLFAKKGFDGQTGWY